MIPASFEYERAGSLDEALSLLAAGGDDARPLAGGHSLLPLMRLRLARPSLLVDIGGLDELRGVRADGDSVEIGALTTHHELAGASELSGGSGLIAKVAEGIGDPQVRHRGTIGGSVAHADPASDLPAALLALDAEVSVAGSGGTRSIAAADFFVGPFMSAMDAGEIVTGVRVPRMDGWGSAYRKFQRRAQDWAIVGVAAVVDWGESGIAGARIGLTNMGGTPLRAGAVEAALAGASEKAEIMAAAAKVSELDTPPADENASSEYRLHLAQVLIGRAVAEAAGCPGMQR
ncbi:FAD binding domain-containing protein [Candidatus Palauibacter sp.]|uniref:FAD binding domain-containing protein n=1 Tax=Candidatus Palauibacter sp. TaxID=3101350 RepID=UPI003B01A6C5